MNSLQAKRWMFGIAIIAAAMVGCDDDDDTTGAGGDGGSLETDSGTGGGGDGGGGVEADTGVTPDEGVGGGGGEGEGTCDSAYELNDNGDGTWGVTARTSGDTYAGTCSFTEDEDGNPVPGADAVVSFTAPAAGLWVFDTMGTQADTVVYLRTNCADEGSELACNDDYGDYEQGEVQSIASAQLNAGDEVFIFVDSYNTADDFEFTLNAESVIANAPTLSGVWANSVVTDDGQQLIFEVEGSDADEDIAAVRFVMIDDAGNPIPFDAETPHLEIPVTSDVTTLITDGPNFLIRLAGGLDAVPGQVGLRAWAVDATGMMSDPVDAMLGTTDVGADARCNPLGFTRECTDGVACVPTDDGDATCAVIYPPSLVTFDAFYNAENPALGLTATGIDQDHDVEAFTIWLLDDAGEIIPWDADGTESLDLAWTNVAWDGDEYTATLSGTMDAVDGLASIRIAVLDAQGQSSDPLTSVVQAPAELADGAECDVTGAFNLCVGEAMCFSVDPEVAPTCAVPELACPADWTVTDFMATAVADGSTWTIQGDNAAAAPQAGGSCGGGGNTTVYEFVAPTAGLFAFEVTEATVQGADGPTGGDTLMYARSHCGVANLELACDDDGGEGTLSALSLELEAGETTYLFVDGYNGGFDGTFTLVASAAVAPVLNTAMAYYNADAPSMGVQVTGVDGDMDVAQAWAALTDADDQMVMWGGDEFRLISLNVEYGDDGFVGTASMALAQALPVEATGVMLKVVDSFEQMSDVLYVDFVAPALVVEGEVCDPTTAMNLCPEGEVCYAAAPAEDEAPVAPECVAANAPELLGANVFYSAETGLLGVDVNGLDPENNVAMLRMSFIDAEGTPVSIGDGDAGPVVGPFDVDFGALVANEGGFQGTFSMSIAGLFDCEANAAGDQAICEMFGLGTPEECAAQAAAGLATCQAEEAVFMDAFAGVRVGVVDVTGLASANGDHDLLTAAPALAEADVCIADDAIGTCPEALVCFTADTSLPTCAVPVIECPADWTVVDLSAEAGWSHDGDSTDAAALEGGSCGGGGPTSVYSFTAADAGDYHFELAAGEGADTLMYARSACLIQATELACNDDLNGLLSGFDMPMAAGEMVYVFVDGFNGEFAGPFTLTATAL